ncbi:MAG: UDP-2,3-diacylglucosamine diphosphatase [Bacteroidota bacterium]
MEIQLKPNKKIYFASDFHLGIPDYETSRKREELIVKWLDDISVDASHILLMGDIFDFWFEYKRVVPKGFVRILGKLAQLTDSGIEIHLFTGNHDMWMHNYFEKELSVIIQRKPIIATINNTTFYLAHGDGIGPGDKNYKLLKTIFSSRLLQWTFSRLHPNFALMFANAWSQKSRLVNHLDDEVFFGNEERLILFSNEYLKTHKRLDYFIFGHRHLAYNIEIDNKARIINLGEWVKQKTFAEFDGTELNLRYYPSWEIVVNPVS